MLKKKNKLDKFLNFELTEYLPKEDCFISKEFEFILNMKFKYFLLSAEMGVQEQDEISYKNHKESHFYFDIWVEIQTFLLN